jgi:predicted PurR-regulated permease PerM
MEQTLDISWETILKFFIAAFLLYVLFLARNIVVWFFFALVISLLLAPAIRFLQWFKLPRIVAAALVYLAIFGALGLMIYLSAPIFLFEINQLSLHIPEYFEKFNPILSSLGDFTSTLVSSLNQSSGSIVKALVTFFGGLYSSLFIFTLAFFISLEEYGTQNILALLTPKKYEEVVIVLFDRAQTKVAGWFGARLLSCLLVGMASFAVFFFLGIKYAFILALLAGVLNFVPYVGPTITLVISVLFVGVSSSWLMAAYVAVALLVLQEIESKILTPFLMKKFINLPPVLVLISLLVGGTVFGFLGTLFAVPVFGIIYEFSKEWLQKRRHEPTGLVP